MQILQLIFSRIRKSTVDIFPHIELIIKMFRFLIFDSYLLISKHIETFALRIVRFFSLSLLDLFFLSNLVQPIRG